MDIYVKLGTHSGRMMRLVRKRKEPVVGDKIELKPLPYSRWDKPVGALVREVRDVGGRNLICVELW